MNFLVERLAHHHQQVESWMKILQQQQLWQELWQPVDSPVSFKIGLLLIAHVIALEASVPAVSDCAEMKNLWTVKGALNANAVVCETMEAMWTDLPDIAACITSDTLLHMATHLQGIHPNIVNPGFKKFIQMKFQLPPSPTCDSLPSPAPSPQDIKEASYQFVDLVNDVKHLDLDAGHWHELWEEGESIGLCIILHYIKHEKRSRLEQLGRIRNVNACINSNIKKIRDGLASTPGMVEELIRLWKRRPDITAQLDGNTLQLLVAELRVNLACAKRCFAHICKKLPETWAVGCGSAENPSAYLYTCVYNFIHSKGGQKDKSSRKEGAKSHRGSSGSIKSDKSGKSDKMDKPRRSSASNIGEIRAKPGQSKRLQEHHSAPAEPLTPHSSSRPSSPLPGSPLGGGNLSSPLTSSPTVTSSHLTRSDPFQSHNTTSHPSTAPSDHPPVVPGDFTLNSLPSQSSGISSVSSPSQGSFHYAPVIHDTYTPDFLSNDMSQHHQHHTVPAAIEHIESWLQQVWGPTSQHQPAGFGQLGGIAGMVAVA